MVTVRIPSPSPSAVTNLLGLAGLVAVVVAVGLLAGWAWALLAAGGVAVGLSVLAQNTTSAPRAAAVSDAPTRELKRVA